MRGLTWSIQDVIADREQFVKTAWWQCNKTGCKIWTKETFMQEEKSLSSPTLKLVFTICFLVWLSFGFLLSLLSVQ